MTEGHSVVVDNSILPTIVTERNNVPVQRFNGDSVTIVNFMKQEVDARAVLATASLFGWESLSTQCNILYIDGKQSNQQSLARSFTGSEIPYIIIECELRDIVSGMEKAQELVSPPGMNKVDISRRGFTLRTNSPLRAPLSVSPFRHGQSISRKGEESKGSVGVFLTPTGGKEESYALTASHVIPVTDPGSTKDIITPAGLDILSMLYAILKSKPTRTEDENFLLTRFEKRCGTFFMNHIGARENGWRSDWALIRLDPEWHGVNGSWHDSEEMVEAFYLAKGEIAKASFSGEEGILNCRDPMGGEPCCKDGAATGSTSGTIGQTDALLFRKHTADMADPEKDGHNIDRCKVLVMNPIMDPFLDPKKLAEICEGGDSGSAVFCADEKNNGWVWIGQLTSVIHSGLRSVGVVIPQSEVLGSLEDVTGRTWRLTSQKS